MMKNKEKRKKNIARKILLRLGALAMACLMCVGAIPTHATSDTRQQMEEAEREKEEREKELSNAQQDLAQTQENLLRLQGVRNTYEGQMEILNGNLQMVADNLAVLENSIALKEMEIAETQANLDLARQTKEDQYNSMKERIRFIYESDVNTYVSMLVSAKSFAEMLNFAVYVEYLSAYDRRMLEEYEQTEIEIAETEQRLESELSQLESMKAEVVEQQNQVTAMINETAANISSTSSSISQVREQEAAYEQQIEQKEDEVAQATAEYEAIKEQYEEELRLSRLAAMSAWRDISQVTFQEGDRYLLANLIYCEAGGEPYEGQVAVGSVVINRVLSSRYPDTVTGVIYQRRQFAPVDDGHLALALANDRATASCYQAADVAMSGSTNVGNCLYFRTPIPGLTGLQIGGHIFY